MSRTLGAGGAPKGYAIRCSAGARFHQCIPTHYAVGQKLRFHHESGCLSAVASVPAIWYVSRYGSEQPAAA
jgi:hypothetical protein